MALLEGHSTVLYGDELYVFGGKDNKTGQLLNTLWRVSVPAAQVAAAQFTTANRLDERDSVAAAFANTSTNSPSKKIGAAAELAQLGSGAVATVVTTTGPIPTPRCYHCVALRPPFMLVWGGTSLHPATVMSPRGERINEERCTETVIFALHLETREWAVHVLPGKETRCPRPRCHATMSTTAHSVLMYGGYPNLADEDTGAAHTEPNHWSVFEVGADAVVRSNARAGSEVPMLWGHSSIFAHGCLCVFGGVDYATMTETNALCLFSLEEKRWRWAEFALAPEARALHSAVLHGSNMFIYGGFTGRPDRTDQPTFNDVWRFSLNTGLWDECSCNGANPPARSGHTSTVVQHNMFVLAGLEGNRDTLPDYATLAILDLHTFKWTMCPITFPTPGMGGRGGGNAVGNDSLYNNNNSIRGGDDFYNNNNNDNNQISNNNNNIGQSTTLTPRGASRLFGSGSNLLKAAPKYGMMNGSINENDNNNEIGSRSPSNGNLPQNFRKSNVSLSAIGGNNNNNQNRSDSPNNNNNNSIQPLNTGTGGGGAFLRAGANSRRGGAGSSLYGVNSPKTAQEKALMEAAAPVAFGFGNTSSSSPPPPILMKNNNNQQQNNNRSGGAGGGIPSASGNSRSNSMNIGAPTSFSIGGQNNNNNLGRSMSPAVKLPNNNNNNNNAPTSSTPTMSFNFGDQIQQYREEQQLQQQMLQNQQQLLQNNASNPSQRFSMFGSNSPNLQPNANNLYQGGSSSILGGLSNSNINNNGMFNPPPRQTVASTPSALLTNSYDFLQQQPNNNNNNIQNNNNNLRSTSNALLSNLNQFSATAQNQELSEKEKTALAVQQIQNEANQQVANLQQQYRQQGVPARGDFDWATQQERTPNNNRLVGGANNNNNNQNDDYSIEKSQARNPGEGRQGSPALTNVWNTDPEQLPGRRAYDSNINFTTGGFAAPAHSLREKAAEIAQQNAIQQHLQETEQFALQQQNALMSNGFGVRPSGGLGRSNSVGLGMPPAMIDSMNNNRNNQQGLTSPTGRVSPSRSSSATSIGRRSMMRTF